MLKGSFGEGAVLVLSAGWVSPILLRRVLRGTQAAQGPGRPPERVSTPVPGVRQGPPRPRFPLQGPAVGRIDSRAMPARLQRRPQGPLPKL